MTKRVFVLSGPVRSGKSAFATRLLQQFEGESVKTRELITSARPNTKVERRSLQLAGERLDTQTKGEWLVDSLRKIRPHWFSDAAPDLMVIDSARVLSQIDALRRAFGRRVLHVHLTATRAELRRRYKSKRSDIKELSNYDQVLESRTERGIEALAAKADIAIDTERSTLDDVIIRVAARVGLLTKMSARSVDIVVGGQYGSEGKGNIVSFLAPEYDYLVRVGSVNAGHQVFLDPIYKFRQLPSGTLHNENAKIVLGPGTQIRLDVLKREIAECQVHFDRLHIDPSAMIIEKRDVDWEQKRLRDSIGSTAQGVGHSASRRVLRQSGVRLAQDIPDLKPYLRPSLEVYEEAYARGGRILLEGTQGTSLSLYHGPYPYVTSRDTTAAGCMAEAGIPPRMVRKVIMICRTYPIRVESPKGGTSGPMSQELNWRIISDRCGIDENDLKEAERTTTTDRQRRVGEFDWVQLRESTLLNAPTDLALSFVDYHTKRNQSARRFEQLDESTINFVEEMERVASAPVSLISTRFHYRSIIDRRNW